MAINQEFLASVGAPKAAGVLAAVTASQSGSGQLPSALERLGIAPAAPFTAGAESTEGEVAPSPMIHVATGRSARSNQIKTQLVRPWADFVRMLRAWPLHVADLTLAEYQRLKAGTPAEKARAAAAKDTGWYSWASFAKPVRAAENVVEVSGFIGDFDDGTLTAAEISAALGNRVHLVTSTCSHHPEAPRWRLHVPYSRPVTPAEHRRLFDYFVSLYRPGTVDTSTRDPSRLWFAPGCWSDTAHYREFHEVPCVEGEP